MNHLWQSTIVAAVAALLGLALRKNRAQMRYWIWLAASLKFLIPFSLLIDLGSRFEWRAAPLPVTIAADQISQPFVLPEIAVVGAAAVSNTTPWLLAGLWFLGCAAVLFIWCVRWRRIQLAVRAASPLPIAAPVKVMSAPTLLEPGVFGIFRPVLLLPEDIANRLTPAQLRAILAHELCHVRRRDNLAAALHMLVEAIFWFHPAVWWIGARMVEERERACDEEVLRLGNEPQEYAQGVLNVCKFYLESPLACASGVTGADLKKRIEAIMTQRALTSLTFSRKLLLAAVAITAVAGPIAMGIVKVPKMRAQAAAAKTFEVASIKPSDPEARGVRIGLLPGGGLRANNVRLVQLIQFAYDVPNFQISGGPGWAASEGFDILAKGPQSADDRDLSQMKNTERMQIGELVKQRLQALLAERFQLVIRRDSKEVPVFALVVAKNGPKLKESAEGDGGRQELTTDRGDLTAQRVTMEMLANILTRRVQRPVLDKTGLKGTYDFKLEWSPDVGSSGTGKEGLTGPTAKPEESATSEATGPSLFTALQEQLGLKLESQKGPVEVLVIEKTEKPSAN